MLPVFASVKLPEWSGARRLPASIYLATPPYHSVCVFAGDLNELAPGSVLFITMDPTIGSGGVQALVSWVRRLHSRAPGATFAARVKFADRSRTVRIRRLLQLAGARLFVDESPSLPELQAATRRSGLHPDDLGRWLRRKVRPNSITARGTIRVLGLALQGGEGIDSDVRRHASRRAREMELPSYRQWMSAGRVIRGLIRLQGEPVMRVSAAAEHAGYADGACFSHACRRVLDVPPTVARGWIGWEWMLDRFLRR